MFKHILVPLDGSQIAEQALPHAEELAKTFGSRLTIISVVEPYVIALPTTPAPVPAYNIDTDMDALVAERDDYLQMIKKEAADRGVDVEIALRRGRPADEILHFAKENQASLIIMTTHGRSGIRRFIYGSVAERVLHSTEVPILLVRTKEPA